jgi:hypothetical protein
VRCLASEAHLTFSPASRLVIFSLALSVLFPWPFRLIVIPSVVANLRKGAGSRLLLSCACHSTTSPLCRDIRIPSRDPCAACQSDGHPDIDPLGMLSVRRAAYAALCHRLPHCRRAFSRLSSDSPRSSQTRRLFFPPATNNQHTATDFREPDRLHCLPVHVAAAGYRHFGRRM